LDDDGYLLAVLLIGMAIAAVWATAALPAWRHQVQRERELELIFRGEQYSRAIALYYLRNNRTLPGDFDVLVQGHYLRKKWKDPISGDEFLPVMVGGVAGGTQPGGTQPGGTAPGGTRPPGQTPPAQGGQQPLIGIIGVQSKSTATSIIVYQNLQQHSQWSFTFQNYCQRARINCNANPNQPQGPGGRPGGPGRDTPGTGTNPRGGGPAGPAGPAGPGRTGPGGGGPGGAAPVRPGGGGPGRAGGGF
jgi:type II secretory pathway pseudopilin PulG